jgi:hypothetical protein
MVTVSVPEEAAVFVDTAFADSGRARSIGRAPRSGVSWSTDSGHYTWLEGEATRSHRRHLLVWVDACSTSTADRGKTVIHFLCSTNSTGGAPRCTHTNCAEAPP